MKRIIHIFLIITLGLIFASVFNVNSQNTTAFAGANYRVSERIVEHELSYGVNHFTDKAYSGLSSASDSQIVNIIDAPASSDVQVVPWSKLGSSRWNMATLTSMAKDFEADNPGYKVIAGINGDFFDINGNENLPNATVGIHVAFGNVYKSTPAPTSSRRPIGFKNDGSTKPIVGNVPYEKANKMTIAIYGLNDEIIYEREVDKVNNTPSSNEIAVYYATWLAPRQINPIREQIEYVIEDATFALAFSENDFYGLGVITTKIEKTLKEGEFSIIVNDPSFEEKIHIGTKLRVQYELAGAFAGLENASGAGKPVIYDGAFQEDNTDFGRARHPRTMIGSKEDGSIVMCVVDGRQTNMTGVRQEEMAAIMHHYGCVDAYNLDGGGSSTMIILKEGEFVVTNSPSDGRERSDSNCLLLVVKVPNIKITFNEILDNSLSLDSQILNDNNETDFFIKLNNKYYKIQNDIIVIANLMSNTDYVYIIYRYTNGQYYRTPLEGKITTAKITPYLVAIEVVRTGKDILIYSKFFDPDKAIDRKKVISNNQTLIMINDLATFSDYEAGLDSLRIAFSYNLNDGLGRVDQEVNKLAIKCHLDVFFSIAKDVFNKALEDILD